MAWIRRYDMADADRARRSGSTWPRDAVRRGELVVLPTDTVYGIGADAFSPSAVGAAARGQGPRPGHAGAGARRLAAHPRRHRHRPVADGPRPGRGVLAGRR